MQIDFDRRQVHLYNYPIIKKGKLGKSRNKLEYIALVLPWNRQVLCK